MPEIIQPNETAPEETLPVAKTPVVSKKRFVKPIVFGLLSIAIILTITAVLYALLKSQQTADDSKTPTSYPVSNPTGGILPKDIKMELGVSADQPVMIYLVKGDIFASTVDGKKTFQITDTKGKVAAMTANLEYNKIAYSVMDKTAKDCGVKEDPNYFDKELPSKIYQYDLSNQKTSTLITSEECNYSESGQSHYHRNMIPLAYSPDATKLVYENKGTYLYDIKTDKSTLIDQNKFLTASHADWIGNYLAAVMNASEYAGTLFYKYNDGKFEKITLQFQNGKLMPNGKVLHTELPDGSGEESSLATYKLYDLATKQDQLVFQQKLETGVLTSSGGNFYNILDNGKVNLFEYPSKKQTTVVDFRKDLGMTQPYAFNAEFNYQNQYFAQIRETGEFTNTFDFVVYDTISKKRTLILNNFKEIDTGILREQVYWY